MSLCETDSPQLAKRNQWKLLKRYMKTLPHAQCGGLFQCDICKQCFTREHSLKMHLEMHFNIRRFQCEICFKRFILKQYLHDHMHTHTGEKPYVCPVDGCGKRFRQRGKLSSHKKEHQKDPGCDKLNAKGKNATKRSSAVKARIFHVEIRFEYDFVDKEVEKFEFPSWIINKELPDPSF